MARRSATFLGYLLVARGPIAKSVLADVAEDDDLDSFSLPAALDRIARFVVGDGETGYAITHWRFADYLSRKEITPADQCRFRLRLVAYCERWSELAAAVDPETEDIVAPAVRARLYSLRHHAGHLAELARGSAQPGRHDWSRRLVAVVADPAFQQAHQTRLNDTGALQRDLAQALDVAVADDHPDSVYLIADAALALLAHRREYLRPEPLFALARSGRPDEAERRLDFFSDAGSDWRSVTLLILAWLAAAESPAAARLLLDHLHRDAGTPLPAGPLRELEAHVLAALAGQSPPPPARPLPDQDVWPELLDELVKNLGSSGTDTSLLTSELLTRPDEGMVDPDVGYLAQTDGPLLVKFAAQDEAEGTARLLAYVAIHAGYGYAEYRNRSLWHLLDAVLLHPRAEWIRDLVPHLAETALRGGGTEFQFGLPLAALILQVASGAAGAEAELADERYRARAVADGLSDGRGLGDSWGSHRRRFGVLAEGMAVVLDRQPDADALLTLARELPIGFAGFQAPACLTLAESHRICRPDDTASVDAMLDAALLAARNIQDERFCAKITARVNAMRRDWWGPGSAAGLDPAAVVARLTRDPGSAEFAAIHLVGEAYAGREEGPHRLPLSADLRAADTLAEIAWIYGRSPSDLLRLNPGPSAGERLANDVPVRVPDPGLAPLLAARLAAEAIVFPSLDAGQRVAMIRALVPVAAPNPTALDTVLARLLLVARPDDATALGALREKALANALQSAGPTDSNRILTSFVP